VKFSYNRAFIMKLTTMLGIAIRPQEHHLHLQKMYMKQNNMKELIDKKVHLRTKIFIFFPKTKNY
jgi:hypothetical protein